MTKLFTVQRRLFWMAVTILVVSHTAFAQTPANIKIRNAIASPKTDQGQQTGWTITVVFDTNFDLNNATEVAAAKTASNYKVININTNQTIPLSAPEVVDSVLMISNRVRLTVAMANPSLNATDLFHLYAFNLTFDTSPPLAPLQSPLMVQKPEQDQAGDADEELPGPRWGLKTSKDRDSSDLYGTYELTKARNNPTTGTGDLKFKLPFSKNFWGRRSVFAPVVDIKASSDADADADSLKFAFEWFIRVKTWDTKFTFPTAAMKNSGVIEAPKDFDNINALWEHRWLFPSAQIGERFRLFFDPFIGFELGKNLRSPLAEAEGKGLFRPVVGSSMTLQIPINNLSLLKGLEFESSYIRRWPLKRELSVEKDDDDNLVALTLGKGPKDFSDSKFIIKVNDYFGPYIGYQWGRLPPNYELVDHKWTFGFLFKSKLR